MKALGKQRALNYRALDVLIWPSVRRLDQAREGETVCVPVVRMRALRDAFEEAFPGAVAAARTSRAAKALEALDAPEVEES